MPLVSRLFSFSFSFFLPLGIYEFDASKAKTGRKQNWFVKKKISSDFLLSALLPIKVTERERERHR